MIWYDSLEPLGAPSLPLKDWLVKPFVLTESLKKCHEDVYLELLQQGLQSLSPENQHYLYSKPSGFRVGAEPRAMVGARHDSPEQKHEDCDDGEMAALPQRRLRTAEKLRVKSMHEGWCREIVLKVKSNPLTYGQISMPIETYLAHQDDLDRLGTNPIGQTLLYNKSNVTRGPFSFATLSASHPLFMTLQALCPEKDIPHFWARRSLFLWDALPLMVLEVFFPTLPDYPIGA